MKKAIAVAGWLVIWFMAVPALASLAGGVDLEVMPDNGEAFRLIPYQDFSSGGGTHIFKKYLEARKGAHYTIVVRNHQPERVGVVIAVDGRNIITGKKSFLGSNEMMYIIDPFGTSRLEGWRTSDNTVNRFYFTGTADSYSVKTFGDVSALGVIAVAVFREKHRPAVLFEGRAAGRQAAPAASGRESSKALSQDAAGTGFGHRQYSPVVKVEFEPEVYPHEKLLVKYEWREELCRKAIISCRPETRNRLWDDNGYAPYPPGYPSW